MQKIYSIRWTHFFAFFGKPAPDNHERLEHANDELSLTILNETNDNDSDIRTSVYW